MIDNNLIYNEIIERLKNAASDNESLQLTPEEVKILAEEISDYACVPLVTGEELMELIKEKTDR
ncbi:hypothetical protein [Acinetobacter radioresistens]|uniref:hypothetical protein n=1 Tax=Acinetobacter radioresistens TaxID=40216 RepID=UPI0011A2487D|nr:hypothetical protein [Acinetobacter radioresistens]MCK4113707.1 hypothetical protein [Acinetobacter radioresistens]